MLRHESCDRRTIIERREKEEAQTKTELSAAHIYVWNPAWESFALLSIEQKANAFKLFVETSQKHFLSREPIQPGEVCIIIAPDLIFSLTTDDAIYSLEEKLFLDEFMLSLKTSLSNRTLVVAGSIIYLMEETAFYAITSHVVTCNSMTTYDKKYSTHLDAKRITQPINTYVNMHKGKKSGYFQFRHLTIGLEICQDHEEMTLKKELGQHFVDLHILLTAGQSIRNEHVCTPLSNFGVMVQCELEPDKIYDAGARGTKQLATQVYSVTKTMMQKTFRSSYFNDLGKQYHIKLCSQSANDIGFDIKHTAVTVPYPKKSPLDLLVNTLALLINMPEWAQFTKKLSIPFFTKGSERTLPEGFDDIQSYCQAYHRGEIDQQWVLHQLGLHGAGKLLEWGLTRKPITWDFYRLLSTLHDTMDVKELRQVLTDLQEIRSWLLNSSSLNAKNRK